MHFLNCILCDLIYILRYKYIVHRLRPDPKPDSVWTRTPAICITDTVGDSGDERRRIMGPSSIGANCWQRRLFHLSSAVATVLVFVVREPHRRSSWSLPNPSPGRFTRCRGPRAFLTRTIHSVTRSSFDPRRFSIAFSYRACNRHLNPSVCEAISRLVSPPSLTPLSPSARRP